MMNFQDQDGLSDYDYCLRMGTNDNNNLYKHHIGYTDDAGTAILSFYQTYLGTFTPGDLNLFRALRFRSRGSGPMIIALYPEDMQAPVTPPALNLTTNPGQELLRQINFTGEKVSVYFGTNGLTDKFTVNRVDIHGKPRFRARPG